METTIHDTLKAYLDAHGIQVNITKKGIFSGYFGKDDQERAVYTVELVGRGKCSYDFGQSVIGSFYAVQVGLKTETFETYDDAISFCRRKGIGVKTLRKPEDPTIADVLYCAFEELTDFESFCDNFGFDTDSRKALEVYEKCMKQTHEAIRAIGANHVQAIREILSEY